MSEVNDREPQTIKPMPHDKDAISVRVQPYRFGRIPTSCVKWTEVEQLVPRPDLMGIKEKIKAWGRESGKRTIDIDAILNDLLDNSASVAWDEVHLSTLQVPIPSCIDADNSYCQFPVVALCIGDGVSKGGHLISDSDLATLHGFLEKIGFVPKKENAEMGERQKKIYRLYKIGLDYNDQWVLSDLIRQYIGRIQSHATRTDEYNS